MMEFANSVICSDLLLNAWNVMQEISHSRDDPNRPISCWYKVPDDGETAVVIAFDSMISLKMLQTEGDEQTLVNSLSSDLHFFHFICTKLNPSIGIDKVVVDHFVSLQDQLTELRDKVHEQIFINF